MEKILEIQKIIIDQFEQSPYYQRDIFADFSSDNHIVGIIGARGVGKTTYLLNKVISAGAKQGKALYVSADNIYFLENRLFDLAGQLHKETDIQLLCIDEIHKYANWNQELKNIADTYKNLQIYFTGSSMIDLVHGKYDLSRRVTLHPLFGFSFREYMSFYLNITLPKFNLKELIKNHIDIAQQIDHAKILKHFKDYLTAGYYPFFKIFSQQIEKFQALENTVQKTIYEDIGSFHSLKTPTLMLIEKLYKFVLSSPPGKLSAYKLSNTLKKDYQSINEYMKYLREAGLIRFIYSNKSGHAQLRKPSKIYPENPNLIYTSFLPQTEDSILGKIRETFVISQLQNTKHQVYYSENGDFCVDDFIFEVGGKNKTAKQIKQIENSYILADGITIGNQRKIPLYLLGLLY